MKSVYETTHRGGTSHYGEKAHGGVLLLQVAIIATTRPGGVRDGANEDSARGTVRGGTYRTAHVSNGANEDSARAGPRGTARDHSGSHEPDHAGPRAPDHARQPVRDPETTTP